MYYAVTRLRLSGFHHVEPGSPIPDGLLSGLGLQELLVTGDVRANLGAAQLAWINWTNRHPHCERLMRLVLDGHPCRIVDDNGMADPTGQTLADACVAYARRGTYETR